MIFCFVFLDSLSHEDSVFGGGGGGIDNVFLRGLNNGLFNWGLDIDLLNEGLSIVLILEELSVAGGALGWLGARPAVAIVMPAWWVLLEFPWALDDLVVDSWVGPVETLEVLAALSQGTVLDAVTVAQLIWVLTVDHPVGARLWRPQGLLHTNLVANIVQTLRWEVKAWRGNVKVVLAVASGVGWRA